MNNLFAASNQWATRPDDERFESLTDLHAATLNFAEHTREVEHVTIPGALVSKAGEIKLILRNPYGGESHVQFSNWAFGQLCRNLGAPAHFLRKLPVHLAEASLSYLADQNREFIVPNYHGTVLVDDNTKILTSLTGNRYRRIWNHTIAERLLRLGGSWRVAPARPAFAGQKGTRVATEADVLQNRNGGGGLSINVGDLIAPAGLYASDHDMFVFMIDEQHRIDDGTPDGLSRGFFIANSEVGAAALSITTFLYRHVCGNHIVWGAENVRQSRFRHVGQVAVKSWRQLEADTSNFANASAKRDEEVIHRLKSFNIAEGREEVIEVLAKKQVLPAKRLGEAYDLAERLDGSNTGASFVNPRSAWGMVQGVTRLSQLTPYADERVAMDSAAGKIIDLVTA